MTSNQSLKDTIFSIQSKEAFERATLLTFYNQAQNNSIYREFIEGLRIEPQRVKTIDEIPFLPISFFKSHEIKNGSFIPDITFTSSGTSSQTPSKHFVKDLTYYQQSFETAFELFYGKPSEYCILALLPTYLERQGSSLVLMADQLIKESNHPDSGFYLNNYDELLSKLEDLAQSNTKTLLLGVSFALLDLAEKWPKNFVHDELVVMETGGMKGRRKEMIRDELHDILKNALHVHTIHSEYGMTELLSQAYSKEDGKFVCPPWIQVKIRDTSDPLNLVGNEKTGGINIIDLANQDSCAFIATEDLGKTHTDGTFEVLGRFDTAEIRGCNLMAL